MKSKERPKIHKEIGELEQELAEKKQELEKRKEIRPEREMIKEAIKEKTEKPQPSSGKIQKKTLPPKKASTKKAKQIKEEKKERQIKLLTDLAFEKGVTHATEVARKLDDAYILDEFHDSLTDELYNYLVEQQKLKRL